MEVACPSTCTTDCESRIKILLEHVYREKSFGFGYLRDLSYVLSYVEVKDRVQDLEGKRPRG